MEKAQSHCMVCEEPFRKDDIVHTDTMFTLVNKYPHYFEGLKV